MAEKEDQRIIERLKPFTDCLKSRLSVRASILNNSGLLLGLRNEGYKIEDILELSQCNYSKQSFSNALYQAKKDSSNIKSTTAPKTEEKKAAITIDNIDTNSSIVFVIDDWIKAFKFNQEVKKTASLESVVDTFEKAGWTPENFYLLKENFELHNTRQLIDLSGEIQKSKFRKIIFKDNKACF
jgi:CRISPR/Cas system-associated protein Cas5 (RAMP superfamily)